MEVKEIRCPECGVKSTVKGGKNNRGVQRYKCQNPDCDIKRFSENRAYKSTYWKAKNEIEETVKENPGKNKVQWTEGKDRARLVATTAIKPGSMEDALKIFKVDTDIWECSKMKINSWDVTMKIKKPNGTHQSVTKTNHQVSVDLIKRVSKLTPEEWANIYIKHVKKYKAPTFQTIKYEMPEEERLLEITNFDLHLGKLCWHKEAGLNYDLKIARERFYYNINDLLNKASAFGYTQILFAVGNDFFQADTPEDTTTAGTRIDTDARWKKRYDVGLALLEDGVELLRRQAPVDVICIPGNHDTQTMYAASKHLMGFFRNAENIRILHSAYPRQYYFWKGTLLGYTHGNKEKLIDLFALMANEAKQYWNRAETKEWHLGHWHHEKSEDHNGVVVRVMKSPAPTDAWEAGKGWVGSIKGSQATLFKPRKGIEANFHSNFII